MALSLLLCSEALTNCLDTLTLAEPTGSGNCCLWSWVTTRGQDGGLQRVISALSQPSLSPSHSAAGLGLLTHTADIYIYIYISQQSYTHKHNTNNQGTVSVKDGPLNTSRLLQCPTCSSFFLSFSHLQWQSEIGGTILGPDLYQTQPPEAWCSMYIIKDLQSRSPEIHHSNYSDIHELLTDQTQVGGPFRKRTYT